jgi:hypothetical protein
VITGGYLKLRCFFSIYFPHCYLLLHCIISGHCESRVFQVLINEITIGACRLS